MKVSICIATYNKPEALRRVLESIVCQKPAFKYEIVIAEDSGFAPSNADANWMGLLPVGSKCAFLDGPRPYGNPAAARNMTYRAAEGDILICQSDDVVHAGPDTIERLVSELRPGRFVIATVVNTDWNYFPTPCLHPNNPKLTIFTGPENRRPLFFLGAVYREDVYAIGGNDERFTAPGYEDNYFVDCLMKGRGLEPHYSKVLGYHLHHDRPSVEAFEPSRRLYQRLCAEGKWVTESGPWVMRSKGG